MSILLDAEELGQDRLQKHLNCSHAYVATKQNFTASCSAHLFDRFATPKSLQKGSHSHYMTNAYKCQEATLLPAKMHWIHQWLLEICQTSLACQHSCLSASRLQFKDFDFKMLIKSLNVYKAQVDLDGKAICQWIRLLPLIFNHVSAVPWNPWQLKKPWHKVASLPLSTPIKSWHAPFSAPPSSTGNS